MWARLSRGGGWEKGRERGAIDCPPVPIDQLAERGRIALPGSLDEVVIGHTDCRQRGGFAGWVDAGCWLLVAGCWGGLLGAGGLGSGAAGCGTVTATVVEPIRRDDGHCKSDRRRAGSPGQRRKSRGSRAADPAPSAVGLQHRAADLSPAGR